MADRDGIIAHDLDIVDRSAAQEIHVRRTDFIPAQYAQAAPGTCEGAIVFILEISLGRSTRSGHSSGDKNDRYRSSHYVPPKVVSRRFHGETTFRARNSLLHLTLWKVVSQCARHTPPLAGGINP